MCVSEAKQLQLPKMINYNGGPVKNIYWVCSACGGVHTGKRRTPTIFARKERGAVKKRSLPVCWDMKLLG